MLWRIDITLVPLGCTINVFNKRKLMAEGAGSNLQDTLDVMIDEYPEIKPLLIEHGVIQ